MKSTKLNIFLTEFLPPLVISVFSLIIYLILVLTKASFATPNQIFLYMVICFIPAIIYIVTFGYIRLPHALKIGMFVYFTCSNLIATTFNLYSYVPFFDTILHTLFGYLCGYLVIYLFSLTNDHHKISFAGQVLLALLITCGIGALWEICEYTTDILTNANSQHSFETGLVDTMQDTFCNTCGALLFSLHRIIDHFTMKNKFFDLAHKALQPIGKLNYMNSKEN